MDHKQIVVWDKILYWDRNSHNMIYFLSTKCPTHFYHSSLIHDSFLDACVHACMRCLFLRSDQLIIRGVVGFYRSTKLFFIATKLAWNNIFRNMTWVIWCFRRAILFCFCKKIRAILFFLKKSYPPPPITNWSLPQQGNDSPSTLYLHICLSTKYGERYCVTLGTTMSVEIYRDVLRYTCTMISWLHFCTHVALQYNTIHVYTGLLVSCNCLQEDMWSYLISYF